MIKLSIEKFTEQAVKSGKFDPQWTVVKVRAGRKKNTKPIQKPKPILIITEKKTEESTPQPPILEEEINGVVTIPLPDSIEKINQMIK